MKTTLRAASICLLLSSGAALADGYSDPVVQMPPSVVAQEAEASAGGAMAVLLTMTLLVFATAASGN